MAEAWQSTSTNSHRMSHRKKPDRASSLNGQYHSAHSVEDLTAKNVKTIAELERAAERKCTPSDRVAGAITGFCGSMAFVWVHVVWFTVWILWNTVAGGKLDPYPFSFLTLVVS